MPLLRLSDCASLSIWDDPNRPEQIAKKWFDDFKDPSPSLYESNSPLEEVEAVAAFHLTNKSAKRKAYHILRIDHADLAAAGICPKNEKPGNTGVVDVDFRHWEIPANQEQLIGLTERLLQKIIAGGDYLRWVGSRLQEVCWQRFLTTPADRIVEEARRRSRCLINKHPFPATLPEQLAKEFWEHPPSIPHERIRIQAQLDYEERLRQGRAGTDKEDWERAENKMRSLYAQQIVGFTSPPGGSPPG